jgi:hypothetical protein
MCPEELDGPLHSLVEVGRNFATPNPDHCFIIDFRTWMPQTTMDSNSPANDLAAKARAEVIDIGLIL